jgi:adenylate kinase family enzyme
MNKYFVIGSAGSGKSTLAKAIAAKTGAKYLELDSVHHQANWQPIDKSEFRKIVDEVTSGESWVIDGNYLSTIRQDIWKRADAVIWLDRPFQLVFIRLVLRTLQRAARHQELWNGNKENFRNSFFTKDSVIYFMVKKWKSQKRKYAAIFDNPESFKGVRLIRLRRDKDVKNFLEGIVI